MKKTLLISGVLLALTVSVASAGGVNLSWTNCGTLGVQNVTFACNANTGASTLYASFDPAVTVTDFVSNEWVVDLQSAGATLPAWWDLKGTVDATGHCRDASLIYSTTFPVFDCADPFGGAIGLSGTNYIAGFSGPNTARIKGVQALNASFPVQVDAATEYYCFTLAINRAKTTGTGACAGCLDPVCIVLNEIKVLGLTSGHNLVAPRDRNFATWQGGVIANPGCPLATPTNKSSWGQVKSLYR